LSFFTPYTEIDKVEVIEKLCNNENISIFNLLDVGLSLVSTDQIIAYESIIRETTYLDSEQLINAIEMAKVLSQTLKSIDLIPEHQIIATLMLLKAAIVNMLGGCGMTCYEQCDKNKLN
jgi:hypothetical protein